MRNYPALLSLGGGFVAARRMISHEARRDEARLPLRRGETSLSLQAPIVEECMDLFNALVQECSDRISSPVVRFRLEKEKMQRVDCQELVAAIWNVSPLNLPADLPLWIFVDNPKAMNTLPVLWAGFSHQRGHRAALDAVLSNVSHAFGRPFVDLEHASHPLGSVMRKLEWDRKCHRTKGDTEFWISMSVLFAKGWKYNVDYQIDKFKRTLHDGTVTVSRGKVVAATVGTVVGAAVGAATAVPGAVAGGAATVGVAAVVGAKITMLQALGLSAFMFVAPAAAVGGLAGGIFAVALFMLSTRKTATEKQFQLVLRAPDTALIAWNYRTREDFQGTFLYKYELPTLPIAEIKNIIVLDFKTNCSDWLVEGIISRLSADFEDIKELSSVFKNLDIIPPGFVQRGENYHKMKNEIKIPNIVCVHPNTADGIKSKTRISKIMTEHITAMQK